MSENNDQGKIKIAEILLRLMGWSAVAFILVAGWLVNPNVTHNTEIIQLKPIGENSSLFRIIEVDQISITKNYPEASPSAKKRGVAFLFLSSAFVGGWFIIITHINYLYRKKVLEKDFLRPWMITAYSLSLSIIFILFVLYVVDILPG